MHTISEVSALSGVSKRTLQYYDQIGLLKPTQVSQAGYRLYDEEALQTLQQILLYRELQFPLKEIARILHSSDYDRNRALEQQIELLKMKKEHLENLILYAQGLYGMGVKYVNFSAFDTRKMDEYAARAKEQWGQTPEYQEFEQKHKEYTREKDEQLSEEMMQFFVRFGQMKGEHPASEAAQALVGELQAFITEHFYTCTNRILLGLGKMYAGGGSFTENIDRTGGEGTAAFACAAIEAWCRKE